MKKTSFIVVTVEEENKYFSYCVKVPGSNNLLSALKIKGIKTANICSTMKEARQIATDWNAAYKRNGTYLFGDAPLF